MPVYGSPQSGGLAALTPGDSATLFNGTETPAVSLASIAIARGTGVGGGSPNGMTFNATGIPSGCTIDVQVCGGPETVAGEAGAQYSTVYTINPDANGNGFYTDVGYSPFYRVTLSAYTSGTMPIVTVQR